MKSLLNMVIAIGILLSPINIFAQIKNAKTETIKIYGNCGMCKSTIEKAGNMKNTALINWNKDTRMATLSYDENKTSTDEILKRIALAGYDSEKFLAPDDVYAKLPECCQYKRELKPVAMVHHAGMEMKVEQNHPAEMATGKASHQHQSALSPVFELYFLLKDALVKSNGTEAATQAAALEKAIQAVDMAKLATKEHPVWMKVMKDLTFDASHISETKDAAHQRDHFTSLSENFYQLMKVAKNNTTVYYQHCPMYSKGKGANWLSKEEEIKNPYYGSQMLTCGSTVETIKLQDDENK